MPPSRSPGAYDHRHERSYRRSPPSRGYDRDDYRRHPDTSERHDRYDDRTYERQSRDYSSRMDNSHRRGYRDRDREGYRSPSRTRSRSRSPKAPRTGQPNKELMLDGLALDMTEEDVRDHQFYTMVSGFQTLAKTCCMAIMAVAFSQILISLKRDYNITSMEDIRIIRDKQTRISRGFGFIKFSTLDQAEEFMKNNFPSIYLSKNATQGDEDAVRIAYSRERGANDSSMEGDWNCSNCSFKNFAGRRLCFRCQAPFSQAAQIETGKAEFVNVGDSDVSLNGVPSQFLVIRGLEASVTEDLLYKGIAKLFKPGANSGQIPPHTKKGKVSSTTGDASLGAKEGSLRRILLIRDRQSNESWRYGFAEYASIDDAQAALSRFSSFEKFTISSKPVYISFIHPGVFVPVFSHEPGIETFTFFPWGSTATRLQYWDENAYANQLCLSDPAEFVHDGSKPLSAADEAAQAAQKEGIVAVGDEADSKSKKRKTDTKETAKPKKSAPAHLEFWSNRHAELHGQKPKDQNTGDMINEPTKDGAMLESSNPSNQLTNHVQSYSHPEKHCCYLCSRQFKSGPEVNKHERLSDLHKKNLTDESLINQALAKMKKAGLPTLTERAEAADQDANEYRDRAKERRKAFGTTNAPPAIKKISLPMKQPAEPDKQVKSKGAALLGKMGWNTGEGLGASGTGMTAPIQTDVYVAGVGLGAEGSKLGDANEEADRNTRGGYAEFVERAKDKAKERYMNMQ